jgi:hypothetical protein
MATVCDGRPSGPPGPLLALPIPRPRSPIPTRIPSCPSVRNRSFHALLLVDPRPIPRPHTLTTPAATHPEPTRGLSTYPRHHSPAPPPDRVRVVPVPGGVAAASEHHGPFTTSEATASGFSHDELGAALAASNLAPRVESPQRPGRPSTRQRSRDRPGATRPRCTHACVQDCLRTTTPAPHR